MKKLLLASAISTLFAVPVAAFAQAKAPAAPTLDKIFDASGITESGYIDAGYTYSNRAIDPTQPGAGVSTRVFDSQNNSFVLHQVGLMLAKQPKEGFGGLVNLTMGRDANVIQSAPGTANATFDVTQAYAQWAGGPLTVIAGKFVTLQGSEVIWSPTNNNISHSILFGAIPFTHTGVRATWAASDTVSVIAGVNNGWDQLTDANRQKTAELGVILTPIKPLSITISGYSGTEPGVATSAGSGNRTDVNLVASYAISDALSIGLEYLTFSQKNGNADGSTAKYDGFAGYVTYMINPKWRVAFRGESFDDKNGFHFGTAAVANSAVKYKEGTLTLAYLPADNVELRAEVRDDTADQAVFKQYDGTTSKSLMTMALQGLYKF